jgi:hypothetical protein
MRLLCSLAVLLALTTAADAATRLRKPKRGFQMKMGAFAVAPGEDLEVCEYRRLPNSKPIDVSGFELRMPAGAHHFVIWSYAGNLEDDHRFPAAPVESVGCAGISPDEFVPSILIPIQTPNARFLFPEGVALRLEPHKQVWLNPHMRNGSPAAITPDIRFNFYKARKGSVQHRAEGMIIGNTTDIRIPALGTQTLTAEWAAPVAVTLLYLATHQHRLGTYANIEIGTPDGSAFERVYENTDWEHPHSYWPEPRIRLTKGQRMRITCTWRNTEPREVRFGPETTDEMCFILGFYHRDEGDTEPVPGQSGCVSTKGGLLCPVAAAVK